MKEELFVSRPITAEFVFTDGIEGPACDAVGNLYAVNYEHQHTIGKITPEGDCSIFLTLTNGSIGNGISFNSQGDMFIADYINHNILKVDMKTGKSRACASVYAHEPAMNQPNDIAMGFNDVIYTSDPNWTDSTGCIWRIDLRGDAFCMERNMGTTNGIEVSADEKTLYVNESVQRRIWAYDLFPDLGVGNKRLLIEFSDYGLDGMRCDSVGNIYVTRYGKGVVAKISPTGEVLLEIGLSGQNCTNIAFGGNDGRNCYVTVADRGQVEMFRADLPGRSWMLYKKWGIL